MNFFHFSNEFRLGFQMIIEILVHLSNTWSLRRGIMNRTFDPRWRRIRRRWKSLIVGIDEWNSMIDIVLCPRVMITINQSLLIIDTRDTKWHSHENALQRFVSSFNVIYCRGHFNIKRTCKAASHLPSHAIGWQDVANSFHNIWMHSSWMTGTDIFCLCLQRGQQISHLGSNTWHTCDLQPCWAWWVLFELLRRFQWNLALNLVTAISQWYLLIFELIEAFRVWATSESRSCFNHVLGLKLFRMLNKQNPFLSVHFIYWTIQP